MSIWTRGPPSAEARPVDVLGLLEDLPPVDQKPANDQKPPSDKGPPLDQKPPPDQTPPTATWTTMKSNVTSNLRAVWGTAFANVFAVGDQGTVLHYDGNIQEKWTSVGAGSTIELRGVTGHDSDPSTAYVVGAANTILNCSTTKGCTALSCTPGTSLPKTDYRDVHAVALGNLFLAGSEMLTNTPVVHRWVNGVCIPGPISAGAGTINGVWAAANNDAFAVADSGATFHDDGSGWSPLGQALPVTL